MISSEKLLLILILFISFIARAEIIEVDSVDKIKQDFDENYIKNYPPQNLLVVIDLDELLFKSLFSQGEQIDKDMYSNLTPLLHKVSTNSKARYIKQLIITNYKNELQDSIFPNFVRNISSKNIPIIAINEGFTGNFNNIPKYEIWFADYLKKNFNIDFSNSFPKNNYIIFNNLKSFSNTYPVFYKGILTNNNIDEAELMINFMVQTNFMPKVFIMISGNTELLDSIQAQLTNYSSSFTFIGYHYNSNSTQGDKDIKYYTKIINDLINQMNKLKINNPSLKTNNAKSKNPYDKDQ